MSEQYYILSPAVGTKETGMAYPAVESYDNYDFNAPNSVHKIKFNEFPDFEPDIRFKLAKGAKLCDMMGQATISGHGFLISERLKVVLESANTVPCKFYYATIEEKGIFHKYYWAHFVWKENYNHIIWRKSDFIVKKFSKNEGSIFINSYEDYKQKSIDIGKIKLIQYTSMGVSNIPFDFFTLPLEINLVGNKNAYELLYKFTGISIQLSSTLYDLTDQDLSHLS
jgi:hypothetical protein